MSDYIYLVMEDYGPCHGVYDNKDAADKKCESLGPCHSVETHLINKE